MKKYNFIIGLGTGLIFSSLLIFIVYNTERKNIEAAQENHNIVQTVSNDEIIFKAKELGMVFADELEAAQVPLDKVADGQQVASNQSMPAEMADTLIEAEALPAADNFGQAAGNKITIDIPKGFSSAEIVSILKDNGVIQDEQAFTQYLVDNESTKKLSYGEYEFTEGMDFEEILNILSVGLRLLIKN
ncbi:MAG: endolytic transglycosylase MltG [Clostridiales bacterium]|jgi:hypothetical protein|nr:endolytic transglycosylase MltG [Clostridiales bacterium]